MKGVREYIAEGYPDLIEETQKSADWDKRQLTRYLDDEKDRLFGFQKDSTNMKFGYSPKDDDDVKWRDDRIKLLNEWIAASKQKIEKMAVENETASKNIDEKTKNRIDSIRSNPVEHLNEVYQWAVRENSSPVLIYGGLVIVKKDGSTRDFTYGGQPEAFFPDIIRNEKTDFANYAKYIRGLHGLIFRS